LAPQDRVRPLSDVRGAVGGVTPRSEPRTLESGSSHHEVGLVRQVGGESGKQPSLVRRALQFKIILEWIERLRVRGRNGGAISVISRLHFRGFEALGLV